MSTTLLAKNLKLLLKEREVTSSQLSECCKIDKSRISRILSGKTANPQIDTLRPIAEFFGITIDQLVGDAFLPFDEAHGVIVPIDRLLVPIIEWKIAPFWLEIKDNFSSNQTIDVHSNISKHAFGLKVENEAYEPRISRGTILIVDPMIKPNDRDYIITHDENKNLTIKQILFDKNKVFLKTIGKTLRLIHIIKDYAIFGVVIEAYLNLLSKD